MNRIKYGVPEIIASFLGTAVFVFVEWLEKYSIFMGYIGNEVYNWFQLRVLVLAVVAVLFGPVAGLVCGVGGGMLINVVMETSISYPEVLAFGVFGLALGNFYDKFGVRNGMFGFREYMDMNAVSLMAGIASGVMVMPLFSLILEKKSLYSTITVGVKSVLGNTLSIVIVCGGIMGIVSSAIRSRNEKKREDNRMSFVK